MVAQQQFDICQMNKLLHKTRIIHSLTRIKKERMDEMSAPSSEYTDGVISTLHGELRW